MLTSGCSLGEEKDILFLRQNLEDFQAETSPYQGKITFTLPTEQILNGIVEPVKISTIYNTDIFVVETYERVNTLNNDREIDILIGLDSHVNEKSGTLLSHFRLNDNDTYTTGNIAQQAFDDKGKPGHFGSGSGDYEGRFGQFVFYRFNKEDLIKSKDGLLKSVVFIFWSSMKNKGE